jgi:hypothetical protein
MSRTPWINALNDMTRPVTLLNETNLRLASEDFIGTMPTIHLNDVHVFPLSVAINGAPGVRYCDKMNRKTSAGAPYRCPKKPFLIYLDEEQTLVDVVPEIKDEISRMIVVYESGQRVHPVYCGHLKDEPVTFEKAVMGKTRVFTAAGMAHVLVTRMYLLSVIMFMQEGRFDFETGPGTVVQSRQWHDLRTYLTHFGEDRIVAGDYSKFDKRMPASVIRAAFGIIHTICQRAGYDEKALRVVAGIALDTAYPNIDFHGDLIEFYGSNPSGHPLTVIINGLANSLYMRYVYTILKPPTETRPFKENVRLMTYGDDNIMGVNPECNWFNHTAIQKVLADIDIGYTMADKEAESVPYIHIDNANFLKRTWRFDPDIWSYVAPLEASSIEKMLTVCVAKPNMSPKAHAIALISTAIREYFWYGWDVFHEKRQMFVEIIEECELEAYVEEATLPSWESLWADFVQSSEIPDAEWDEMMDRFSTSRAMKIMMEQARM